MQKKPIAVILTALLVFSCAIPSTYAATQLDATIPQAAVNEMGEEAATPLLANETEAEDEEITAASEVNEPAEEVMDETEADNTAKEPEADITQPSRPAEKEEADNVSSNDKKEQQEEGQGSDPEESEIAKYIDVSTEVDEMTVNVRIPLDKENKGSHFSVTVTKIESTETMEEAVEDAADEIDMQVADLSAYDIRLYKDGKEIQPPSDVEVTFSGHIPESTTEETKVFHYNERKALTEDMEASVISDNVVFTTSHFSIFIIVDMEQLGGKVDIQIQHWAMLDELKGVDGTEGLVESSGPDGTKYNSTATLNSEETFEEIYANDTFSIANNTKKSIEELSKVLLTNKDKEIKNYKLKEVWVLKEDAAPESENEEDFTIYEAESDEEIRIKEDTVIRLVYEALEAENTAMHDVTFYDYNVSDGTVSAGNNINTYQKGINTPSNFTGGGMFNRIAVGIHNLGVLHNYTWVTLNGINVNASCGDSALTGMVRGVNDNGPIYNGLYDANLFNNKAVVGKKIFGNYKLAFNQKGDTYTLSKVTNGSSTVLSDLDKLKEVWDSGSRHIFSNNFWPMDYNGDYEGKDPMLGGSTPYYNEYGAHLGDSDDGQAHNWFFGMRYDYEFTLGDYTGPLYYYFRGDDDFWLFVDGQLKADIGGIHSSVGRFVDLNYLKEQDKNKSHRITIVYAERGGFGSTCYMQFTLPNVKAIDLDSTEQSTSATVTKNWDDKDNPFRPSSAKVQLMYKAEGETEYKDHGDPVTLTAPSWSYTYTGLPIGDYTYKVVETDIPKGYTAEYENGGILTKTSAGTYEGNVTNTLATTSVKVTTKWEDNDNYLHSRPDEMNYQLYYKEDGEWKAYPGDNGILTFDGNTDEREMESWNGIIKDLPLYDPKTGEEIEYTVKQLTPANDVIDEGASWEGKNEQIYSTTYEEDTAGKPSVANHITITNSLENTTGSIKITKRISTFDAERGKTVFWFRITGENDYVKDVSITFDSTDGSVIGLNDSGKSVTVDGLSPGKYTVKELPTLGYSLAAASKENKFIMDGFDETIPYDTALTYELEKGDVKDAYFWNTITEAVQYTITNEIRFNADGSISLSNTMK